MNPAKYGGRKFDMRVWAMITSTDPLRIVLERDQTPTPSTLALALTLTPTPTPSTLARALTPTLTLIPTPRQMLDRKFMPKISTKHYSTSIESMGDSCMHFKMPMGAG